ncbi:ATP-binding protein [Ruminiclostridium cellobioparum]|jgi:serine/threonine-protein kinase RsbT|uniref:Anti-sigma regulatory factor (Ser/Thr protein kinase) n=1 Tax=Ruminiclostridium cellobioparum subsp. termitidis CT1112 TaxID=1195236 RepID=S0FQL3_RUMCE|nr:ATP-binding protein [Ruminiclostridium cellobioparum]EMS71454.1 Anti-sigma regulatory factor (Ser/Thr protein kinase) [Ruminiclostridium cellobioparum subsp. termitidis CT1112]
MSTIKLKYDIPANDFVAAGEASSNVKKKLAQIGIAADKIKKAAIAMYEAEINAVIHANGGTADVEICLDRVVIAIIDNGPGIPDLELAMTEGYSTASDNIREMGFGAGMGLPNMKKYADKLDINTEVGIGTKVTITVYFI